MDSEVTFRFQGDDIPPDEVSKILGIPATRSHSKGDPRISSSGRRYSNYSEGYWSFQVEIETEESLTSQLEVLLQVLGSKKEAIATLRSAAPGSLIDIFVGIFDDNDNVKFSLSADLWSLLHELDLPLNFDVYR